jgi:DNA-binding CsgD family transcriptional regulator
VTSKAALRSRADRAASVSDRDYAWCARVPAEGPIEEVSGRAAVVLLGDAPDVVAYARALIASGRPSAAFWWPALAGWWSVSLEVVDESAGGPGAAEVRFFAAEPPHRLTARELDVLTLMAGGLSNTEIARRLFTSPKTISTHVEHVLRKLGTATRAGAAAVALEQGLVRLPIPGGGLESRRPKESRPDLRRVPARPGASARSSSARRSRSAARPKPTGSRCAMDPPWR